MIKPIASMCLGVLVSSVAIAAPVGANGLSKANPEFDALRAKVEKLEAVLDQNVNHAYNWSALPMSDWAQRLTVSGLVDVGAYYSNKTLKSSSANMFKNTTNFSDSSYQLDNEYANLYFDAEVNCYTRAHLALNLRNVNVLNKYYQDGSTLHEAFVTISNFASTPVYLRAGIQYVPFGEYNISPISSSMTQLLSEIRPDKGALTLGFVSGVGFDGALAVFQGTNKASDASKVRINNWVAHLGYRGEFTDLNYSMGLEYLGNMHDVEQLTAVRNTNVVASRVGAWAFNAGAKYAAFDAALHYVSAAKKFSTDDYSFNAVAAKPWAVAFDVGYHFDTVGLPSRVGLGYEESGKALGFGVANVPAMPKRTWKAEYGVEVGRNTDLTFQLLNEHDYKTSEAATAYGNAPVVGTGRSATTGMVRLAVRLA